MKILVYDCEIKNLIPNRNEPKRDGFRYCEGWHDFKGMGISVVCTAMIDTTSELILPSVYLEGDRVGFFKEVMSTDMIVGYNNFSFDDNLIEECWDSDLHRAKSLDMYVALKNIVPADKAVKGALTLDTVMKNNYGLSKGVHGGMMPMLWQGKRGSEVVTHCIQDVVATAKLVSDIYTSVDGYTLKFWGWEAAIFWNDVSETLNKWKRK